MTLHAPIPAPEKRPLTVRLATPRGFCAGVDRAIQIVERAIGKYGAPVYVRHEIVHNRHVVDRLKAMGAVFVKELDECPDDRPVVFSAHGVADQDDVAAGGVVAFRLDMDLGHQRTGGVEIKHLAGPGAFRHGLGHAVGRKDHGPAVRAFVELAHEDGAHGLEPLHDVTVVHDLVADIDRRPVFPQRPFDNLDGPVDAGAEAPRRRQPDHERALF